MGVGLKMLDGTHYFECECGADEHTLRFVLDKGPEDPCVYTSIFLYQYRPWWKRIWVGIKYIFGYKSKYGHWGGWELQDEDVKRLRDMCEGYLEGKK